MTIDWLITLFCIHALAAFGATILYREAPCWMQKVVVIGFVVAMGTVATGYLMQLGDALRWGWWGGESVVIFGMVIEHIAVLLMIFRLNYQEHLQWRKSSEHSRSYQG